MPTSVVTDEEVNDVREVAGELDFSLVATLIDSVNEAQWQRALELIDAWQEFDAGDVSGLQGGRDGVRQSNQDDLDDIRRRMRLLLGLPELRSTDITGGAATTSVPVLWVY